MMYAEIKYMIHFIKDKKISLRMLSLMFERMKRIYEHIVLNDEFYLYEPLLSVCIGIHYRAYCIYHYEAMDFIDLELSESILFDSDLCMMELTDYIIQSQGKMICRDT